MIGPYDEVPLFRVHARGVRSWPSAEYERAWLAYDAAKDDDGAWAIRVWDGLRGSWSWTRIRPPRRVEFLVPPVEAARVRREVGR